MVLSRCDLYFVIDNSYAKLLLKNLIEYLKGRNLVARSVNAKYSQAVNKCANSMYNYIKAAIDECSYIVILVDSERESPESVKKGILDKHVKDLNVESSRIKIIVATPCLEEWLCKLMVLRGLKPEKCSGDSCDDVISAIRGVLGNIYEKKMLPAHFMKYLSDDIVNKCLDQAYRYRLPSTLCELLELLKAYPTNHREHASASR
jgi:hypothetical protein